MKQEKVKGVKFVCKEVIIRMLWNKCKLNKVVNKQSMSEIN